MADLISLSNTDFKRCLTKADLQSSGGATVSEQDLATARKADDAAQQALTSRLVTSGLASNQATSPSSASSGAQSLISLLGVGGASSQSSGVATTNTGLTFSIGSGYTKGAQYWLQPLEQGNAQKAAVLLAYDQPVKTMLKRKYKKDPGALDDTSLAGSVGVLGLVERATVDLGYGNLDCAVNFLDFAAQKSDRQQGSIWGSDLRGYEHIMMLNLKSMSYLLGGDERARNVAQASRELQQIARDDYAAQLAKKQAEAESQSQSESVPEKALWMSQFNEAFSNSALNGNASIAQRVATPYVNPLADYLSAVVLETEGMAGTGNLDTWSTASNAWRNAATLAPNSKFLSAAAQQATTWNKNGPPAGTKVINVLVAQGAAPQRAVASIYFNYQGKPFPVMIPVLTPEPTRLSGGGAIEANGVSAPLEIVSDVEGMAMRHAEDERGSEMLGALVRGWVAFQAGEALGANSDNALGKVFGGMMRDAIAEPSTDGWSSLPKGYYAARLTVPANATEVKVTVPGAGTQSFPVNSGAATFVYVTAKDGKIWGAAQKSAFGEAKLDFEAQ